MAELLLKEFEPEQMTGENQVYCMQCKVKRNSVKRTTILTYPRYLNLTLKMFTFTGGKLPKLVAVPFHLHLISNEGLQVNYMLVSAIIHSGSRAQEGHYKQIGRSIDDAKNAWARKSTSSNEWESYGTWIYCNDEIKRPTTVQHIKGILGLGRTKNSFECAYNVTYIEMVNVHGIALPKMPNIPLYQNESQYDNVTIDDWEHVDENKSDNSIDNVMNDNYNAQQQHESINHISNNKNQTQTDENDWNMLNIPDINEQKSMEIDHHDMNDQQQTIQIIHSSTMCLPKL